MFKPFFTNMLFKALWLILMFLSVSTCFFMVADPGLSSDGQEVGVIRIVDDLGREVILPSQRERIISLAPAATEILFYIGAGNSVVGVTRFCDFPLRISEIAKVGDFLNPDIEKILGLAPSVVFLTSFVQETALGKLESFGIPAFVSYPAAVDSLPGAMSRIAAACGIEEEATPRIESFKRDLETIKKEAAAARAEFGQIGVYFEIGTDPLMSIADNSFESTLIRLAGGVSCSGNLPRKYALFSAERVIAADPDVIVIAHKLATFDDVSSRKGWDGIKAVKQGRIVTYISEDLLVRPGPRILDGAKQLAAAFYPEYPFSWLRGDNH